MILEIPCADNSISILTMRIETLDYFEEQMLDPDLVTYYRQGVKRNILAPVVFNEFVKKNSELV